MYYKQIDNEQVEKLLLEKDYNQILRIFFDSLNMSVVQFAARMKCSRRAMGLLWISLLVVLRINF